MPLNLPPAFRRQPFSTAARVYPTVPSRFHSYHPPAPRSPINPVSGVPKLGRVSRWYLPAMAFIAVGIAIANALEEYNMQHMSEKARLQAQQERNEALLEAYGERMSLSDVEKALEVYEVQ